MNRFQKLSALSALSILTLTIPIVLTGLLQPAPMDGERLWYGPTLVYHYAAAPLSALCGLMLMGLAVMWLVAVRARSVNRGILTLAFVFSLITSGLMCWSSLPVFATSYRHIASASLARQVYQLGVLFPPNPAESYYVVSECDSFGLVCTAHYLYAAGQPNFTELPQWVADPAAHTLTLRVGEQTIYTYHP